MGFRNGAVLSATSFFLGVLFITFNVDRRILYSGGVPSEDDYADAFRFYKQFYDAPMPIQALLHAVMGLGLLATIAKLHSWDESAVFFDGSSVGAFLIGIILYISVSIPTLRTVATPIPEDTIQDQREALSVLAAGNTLIAACLVAVLLLQGGQEYARRADLREIEREKAEAARAAAAVAVEKKDK